MTIPDPGPTELALLNGQLVRMRAMPYGYSALFFARICDWAIVTIALLVIGSTDVAPAAVAFVPFLVPFAFLETGYRFFYTVGAGLLWIVGFTGLVAFADGLTGMAPFLVPAALVWTAAIAGYLFWAFLIRRDERRLMLELGRWEAGGGR